MASPTYPRLSHLFGAYMHQDWGADGEDWPDLVRNYATDQQRTELELTAAELDRLAGDFPEDTALEYQVFRVLGCEYDPRPDLGGPTVREWLVMIANFLRGRAE